MYVYACVCVCSCVCMCVYVLHANARVYVCVRKRMRKLVMLGGVACISYHVICQVSAGTVSETVLQTCVWVTVIEVTCMEG